jgi:hypothetical protein
MPTAAMPDGLSTYETKRWDEIQDWKVHATKPSKVRLPVAVKDKVEIAAEKARSAWEAVPGNDQVEKWIAEAINGSFHMTIDLVAKTVDEERIVRKVSAAAGFPLGSYADLAELDLRPLDKAAPDQKVLRSFIAAGHGAAAGFVAGGAAGVGAASGGMGALPAAGVVAGTLVTDAAALVGNMVQSAAYVGAHYGFDAKRPQEHAILMSMLGAGIAKEAGKVAAMMRVRDLALALAAKKTIAELSKKQLYHVLRRIYGLLLLKTTKRSIAKGVPILGVGLGAGINYGTVRKVVDAAQHLYPERFLVVKYSDPGDGIIDLNAAFDDLVDEADEGIMQRLDELPNRNTDDADDTSDPDDPDNHGPDPEQ